MPTDAKTVIPFEFGVQVSGDTFTDRVEETQRLCANFQYGVNTILISPRRMGKTSLVDKVIRLSENESIRIARFDALKCASEEEFLNAFATAVIQATSTRWEKWMELAKRFLSRFVPKISIGSDPISDFSISFELRDIRTKAQEVLQLPEEIAAAENIRVVVCIDEFHDSLEFQRLLRSVWQLQKHVSYCLYGSKKSLMETLFGRQSNPFYRFGDIIYLQRIGRSDWVEFICRRFKDSGKTISEALAGSIADMVENYPAYVQQLAWYVWLETDGAVQEDMLNSAMNKMLDAYQPMFSEQVSRLTLRQKNFLKALGAGVESGFSKQKVLEQYQLGSSAAVSRAKKSLIEKDLIALEGTDRLVIADPVFKLWLNKRFWNTGI